MSWQSDSTFVLRIMIGDITEPQTYTDDTLENFVLVAAKRIVGSLRLGDSYTVNINSASIQPDPTTQGIGGESVMNLIELYSRIIILEGEAKRAANQAIAIKDGPSAIDLKEVAKSKLALLKQAKEDYENAILDFWLKGVDGDGVSVGHAVVGPIRLGLGGYGYYGHTRGRY